MVSWILTDAIEKAARLPEADQESIARSISDYVDSLQRLRAELQKGVRSLAAGKGKELTIEAVIVRARAEHAKR